MGAATAAHDLVADHVEAAIGLCLDVLIVVRPGEAGPARPRVVLARGVEQRRPAADALVRSLGLVVPVAPGEGASVPFSRVTWYCSGVSFLRYSASLGSSLACWFAGCWAMTRILRGLSGFSDVKTTNRAIAAIPATSNPPPTPRRVFLERGGTSTSLARFTLVPAFPEDPGSLAHSQPAHLPLCQVPEARGKDHVRGQWKSDR